MRRTFTLMCSLLCGLFLIVGCGGDGSGSTNDPVDEADVGNNGNADVTCQSSTEVCDGEDNDCDGEVDEDDVDGAQTFYPDGDGDGYGDESGAVSACDQPADHITTGGDCDDTNPDIHPDAAEICDNVDNNCDAQVDLGNIAALDCTNQTGVCAGSTTAVCDQGAYATCGADEYGASYRASDDEAWRCDGLDNDCDGAADEACCGDSSGVPIPTPSLIGSTTEEQSLAAITPAASSAPDGAAFLIAWRAEQQIQLQHIDEAGEEVGGLVTFVAESSNDGSLYGLDVTSTDSGYELVWTGGQILRQESGGGLLETETWLKVRAYTAELVEDGGVHTFREHHFDYPDARHEVHRLHEPRVAAIGDARMVVYVSDKYSLNFKLNAIHYSALDRANPGTTLELRRSGTSMASDLPHPVLEAYGSTFVIAWSNSRGGTIGGRSYEADGTPGPHFETTLANDAGDVSLDIAHTGDDQLMLIYPKPDNANPPLVGLPVTISTGDVASEVELADASTPNSWPTAVSTDTDGDSRPDTLLIAWRRGDLDDPAIVVGATSLDAPGLITDQRTLKASGQESITPAMVAGDNALGAVWLSTSQRDRVEFVPVSIDGVAICQPQL